MQHQQKKGSNHSERTELGSAKRNPRRGRNGAFRGSQGFGELNWGRRLRLDYIERRRSHESHGWAIGGRPIVESGREREKQRRERERD